MYTDRQRGPVVLTRLPYGKHLPGGVRSLADPLGLARGCC
jgi:hypothetical protein